MTEGPQPLDASLEHVIIDHPLSGLAEALATGDLGVASVLINQAPWTNLANALGALPETDRHTAYQLLWPEIVEQIRTHLSTTEYAVLQQARSNPHTDKNRDSNTDADTDTDGGARA